MGAQIKTLSFLAYIIRIYQQVVGEHSQLMVEGILGMLSLCPMEVTHLRKELLIAARHILATDLRISKILICLKGITFIMTCMACLKTLMKSNYFFKINDLGGLINSESSKTHIIKLIDTLLKLQKKEILVMLK